jgi:purine-binding chemotaxis protein CheW
MAMQPSEYSATTVIIVVSSVTQTGRHDVGFVVDSVSDVVDLRADSVQPMPSVGAAISADYIRGISIDGMGMVMLLDIDQIIGGEQRLMASSTATT